MKNRSITYLLLFGICSMLAIMQSCQKTDDLEADINSLKDRVAALEKATEGLNTSFASLQALMQKNKVIIGITPTKDGLGYLLELSDGTSIKVMESEAVQASVPEFSVDEEGYWIYKTSNDTDLINQHSGRYCARQGRPLSVINDRNRPQMLMGRAVIAIN